jgi:8-oxo-dGTP pyrophosphatase MutT (NUDIX family)
MQPQTYKIYVNGRPVFLTTPEAAARPEWQPDKTTFNAAYVGQKKMLRQYLDLLDKNRAVQLVVLHARDVEALWRDFQACFDRIDAAGGYVVNPRGELLVFYRRGSWDLPKGKIDPGETPEVAAVREVREETGLRELTLGPFLLDTWHTYTQKGRRILKKTWWYKMTTPETDVTPQTEEDIEEIQWVEPEAWLAGGPEAYGSIRDVIRAGLLLP